MAFSPYLGVVMRRKTVVNSKTSIQPGGSLTASLNSMIPESNDASPHTVQNYMIKT